MLESTRFSVVVEDYWHVCSGLIVATSNLMTSGLLDAPWSAGVVEF